jgi:hypothetical protein
MYVDLSTASALEVNYKPGVFNFHGHVRLRGPSNTPLGGKFHPGRNIRADVLIAKMHITEKRLFERRGRLPSRVSRILLRRALTDHEDTRDGASLSPRGFKNRLRLSQSLLCNAPFSIGNALATAVSANTAPAGIVVATTTLAPLLMVLRLLLLLMVRVLLLVLPF